MAAPRVRLNLSLNDAQALEDVLASAGMAVEFEDGGRWLRRFQTRLDLRITALVGIENR